MLISVFRGNESPGFGAAMYRGRGEPLGWVRYTVNLEAF